MSHCHIFDPRNPKSNVWIYFHCPCKCKNNTKHVGKVPKEYKGFILTHAHYMTSQIFQAMRFWRYSPFSIPTINILLPSSEACKVGPKTPPGLMTTMSKPFSFTKSHAAFSASVFDNAYQSCTTHMLSNKSSKIH